MCTLKGGSGVDTNEAGPERRKNIQAEDGGAGVFEINWVSPRKWFLNSIII